MSQADIQDQLKQLPKEPGVYFHKNAAGEIIYIGKAARLNHRVRHYFQKSRLRDPKTDALVAEIASIDWTVTDTEIDALFLEAELIRRYQPKYNILLRDDKSLTYIRINYNDAHPTVTTTRRPLDDNAKYFGPYMSGGTVRRALRYLRKIFPFSTHTSPYPKRACLQAQLGLCPGLEVGLIPLSDYKKDLSRLIQYLSGGRKSLIQELEKAMRESSKAMAYEEAAKYRNQLSAINRLRQEIIFSDKESIALEKDEGLSGLTELLQLSSPPRRIEGYDISHMQGSDTVASMVVFTNGVPDKAAYRKFKMKIPGNDDFIHMHEVLSRRFAQRNQKTWPTPDLCLIDGGKGQLQAAITAIEESNVSKNIAVIGLAKRFEEIIVHKKHPHATVQEQFAKKSGAYIQESDSFVSVSFPLSHPIVKLLQRIRDESHRFAVSYHSVLKVKRTLASQFDEIPGVGPKTKQKLLKTFGSMTAIKAVTHEELAAVVGENRAKAIRSHFG